MNRTLAIMLVIFLARSGSSFLGKMLSLPQPSEYFFEPLRKIHWSDSALEHWGETNLNRIVPKMSGIFRCDPVSTLSDLVYRG